MHFLITGRYIVKNRKPIFYLDKGWKKFFKKINSDCVLFNPKKKFTSFKNYDCLIVSGGGDIYNISNNKLDKYRDKIEIKLIKSYLKYKKPIIFVCRGFQLTAKYYKNKLVRMNNHVRVHHSLKIKKNIYIKYKKMNVNSYHKYGLLKLGKIFNVVAKSKDGSIEIAVIKNKKILCTMFHPERHSKSQDEINELIFNFLKQTVCN